VQSHPPMVWLCHHLFFKYLNYKLWVKNFDTTHFNSPIQDQYFGKKINDKNNKVLKIHELKVGKLCKVTPFDGTSMYRKILFQEKKNNNNTYSLQLTVIQKQNKS
jgi:hypothetical protein